MQIPGYIIESNLGSGAMATVYLATQEALERKVALKLMAASLVADPTFQKRFLQEGKIVAKLNHPNIVTMYDIGVFQTSYYMAMEYVEGGMTLKDYIEQRPLPVAEAIDMLCQMADALGYAHQRNIVHRDIKPANILLRPDRTPVLSDFGIAKTLGEGTQMTQQGFSVGTPTYMSPEQALGKAVDSRCDLYSLGVMLFEMVTGAKPYEGSDSFVIALKHVNDPIPQLPDELKVLQPIVERLMAKEPADRFASADELIAAIRPLRPATVAAQAMSGDATRLFDHPRELLTRPTTKSGTAAWAAVMGGASVVMVAVIGIVAYLFIVDPNNDTTGIVEVEPPSRLELLTPEQQAQVNRLLEIAKLNHEIGRLVDPPVSNAAHTYREVLKIAPRHEEARMGLQEIADTFEAQARTSILKQENPSGTLNLVEAGLIAMPDHSGLLALKRQLNAGLSQN